MVRECTLAQILNLKEDGDREILQMVNFLLLRTNQNIKAISKITNLSGD